MIERCAAGDEDALLQIYERYSGMLLSLALSIVKVKAEAEEVLQEAFLYAWNRAARYDPSRSSVSTWLVLITRSRAIDRMRQSNGRRQRLSSYHQEKISPVEEPTGVKVVHDQERRRRVQAALRSLPAEQAEVLALAYYRGLTQSEIAALTTTPLGTVKTRTLLGMRKLRRALASELDQLL